jgi:hypothetical protein
VSVTVAAWPRADGLPLIGFLPGPARGVVYLALTHSGVTLAPLVAALATEEITGARFVGNPGIMEFPLPTAVHMEHMAHSFAHFHRIVAQLIG